ncbi:MAG: hypothetical protein RLZZ306_3081 [Bacteroidota bacterium]|jgi:hypothetical protein
MKLDYKNSKRPIPAMKNEMQENFNYPPNEDIYAKFKEESDINPENPSRMKGSIEDVGEWNEKSFNEDMVGDDLDVPGSEMDNEQENNGMEDEENNYYSLGGDNHDDLEENRGLD